MHARADVRVAALSASLSEVLFPGGPAYTLWAGGLITPLDHPLPQNLCDKDVGCAVENIRQNGCDRQLLLIVRLLSSPTGIGRDNECDRK